MTINHHQKTEYLTFIYKNLDFSKWSECINYTVATDAIREALQWALSDDNSGILINIEDNESISVGQQLEITITPPEQALDLRIFGNANDFLYKNQCAAPDNEFYIIEDKFFSKDQVQPEWYKKYKLVINWIGQLRKLAIVDKSDELIFIEGSRKVSLLISYNLDTLGRIDPNNINLASSFIDENEIQKEQKKAIFTNTVIDLVGTYPKDERFKNLLSNLDTLLAQAKHGYALFCSSFSFEKFKEKLADERLDYFIKAHNIFSGIQNQVLGIPVATFLATTQMKMVAGSIFGSNIFWTNLGILLGSIIYCILTLLAFYNQNQTALAVEKEIARQKERAKKELNLAELPNEIIKLYQPLDDRVNNQKRIIFFLSALVVSITVLIFFVFIILSVDIC